MDKTSTPYAKKSVKKERPSRQVMKNILDYSKSLSIVSGIYGKTFLLINN